MAENSTLPEGIDEADLVEGPKVVHLPSGRGTFLEAKEMTDMVDKAAAATPLVRPIPQAEQAAVLPVAPPVSGAALKKDYPAVIEAALDILSARLLSLIAMLTACLIWVWVIYDPELWRIVAACGFSFSVFLPSMVLYWREGMVK